MLLKTYNLSGDFLPARIAAIRSAVLTLPGGDGEALAVPFETPADHGPQGYPFLFVLALSNLAAAEGRAFTVAVEDEDGRVYAGFDAEGVGADSLRVCEKLTVFPPEGAIRVTNGGAEAHTVDLIVGWGP